MSKKIDYKSTVNLPTTSFSMKANLPQKEPELLSRWEKEKLYAKLEERGKDLEKYILHDGPPYANGNIHIGHALNKILKDIVVKYKTMCGFNAYFLPGWDCHGLPIEHQLFKEMGISKHDIDRVKFRKKARKYAEKYVNIQKEEFKRLGVFGEWDKPYLTMNHEYQAAIVESFYRLYESGYIFEGIKPIHWCPTCETALAEAELEYADKTSNSIFVTFKLDLTSSGGSKAYPKLKEICAGKPTYVLIWTTTPWTLPANVAIALHPELDYAIVDAGGEIMIFAEPLFLALQDKLNVNKSQILHTLKGKDFEHLECFHPFIEDRKSKIVLADYVSHEEGSGCVHIAPGHGEEDYLTGLKYNLPIISPVNDKGEFTEEFPLAQGENVFKANKGIVKLLKKEGLLKHESEYRHSYPHCWRCKNPVIFRATPQWFLKVDHENLRKKIVKIIKHPQQSRWTPEWGQNRILGMIEIRPDWCLSRQRYWGVPIPMFYCASCEGVILNGEIIEKVVGLVKSEGADVWFQKEADEILPKGTKCPDCGGETFKKDTDIIDVWFDSGVSHQAVLKNNPKLDFPCELYLEGSDQHRGWFQTSLITAVALEGVSPFKQVLTHGFVVDGEGKKMSKSAGNVIAPQEVIKNFGADVLRLWVSSCDYQFDVRLSNEILNRMVEAYRRIRNTFRFILGNIADFDPRADRVDIDKLDNIDRWALGKCLKTVEAVTDSYENFKFHQIYRLIHDFCTVKMSSFYFDAMKDRLYTSGKNSPERRSTQTVLYYVLRNLVKVLAPLLSFTCEEVWSSYPIQTGFSSVHEADWPKRYPEMIDEDLIRDWDDIICIRDVVMKRIEEKREKGEVKSSLEAKITLFAKEDRPFQLLKKYEKDLHLAFVTSLEAIEIKRSSDFPSGEMSTVALESDQKFYHVDALVERAEGAKCERCWMFSKTVGDNPEYPTICKKCQQSLEL